MKNVLRLVLCGVILASATACAIRPEGPGDSQADDDQPNPNPQPTGCQSNSDCNQPPSNCDVGTCSRGACSYASSCDSGEVCNAQSLCETPPPPPPPSGKGTIVCTESGTQTNVTIANGIVAHLTSTGAVPNGNWTVRFGTGGTDVKPWTTDSASYTLAMPNTVAHFNFVLQNESGNQYWFDLNEFEVSGTCSHAQDAGDVTHATQGTNPGNGNVFCSESGSQTTISVSSGVLAHLFDAVSPNSNWTIGCGTGGCTGSTSWQGDGTVHTFTVPNGFTGFNLVLREPNGGAMHWFDVSEYTASGTCSIGTNEFRHVPGNGMGDPGNGTISCTNVLNGQYVDVTVSTVAAHLKKSDGSGLDADGTVFPNASYLLRWGSDQSGWGIMNPYDQSKDQEGWVDGSILLRLPGSTVTFNAALYNPSTNAVYWLDLEEFNVTGDCSHPQGAGGITHATSGTTGNGNISCSESGSQTNVTISNGILAHLVGTPASPAFVQFAYGGSQSLSWNGDGASYAFTMGNSITSFNFQLRDVNGNTYPFDTNEFNVSGTCSRNGSAFTHTTAATTNVGTIKCRLWEVGGIVKREVTIIPNGNGILAGTFQDASPLPSPEAIRLDVDGEQQPWVGNGLAYIFYPILSVTGFNFKVMDDNDPAGGDYFNLAAWTVTNEVTVYGSSNCHVVGGGISVN